MLRRRTPEHEAGRLLTTIYREHSAGAYRFAYHLTRSREDADDLVQVAFLGLHGALVRGDKIVSPGAWLSTTIKRSAINLGRKRRERPSSDDLDHVAGGVRNGDAAAEAAEDLARIQLLLYTLPEAQHHAFVLRHWSGLPNREIAEVLATSESAAESLLVRARAALLAARSTDQACAQVCSRLATEQPLAPEHATHLSGCKGCRTAEQRLAKAVGIAAVATLVPNLHVAHALAATVPGFSVGMATGAGGGLAAAAGTKAGAVGVLAKTGAAVVALTAVTAIGVHAHLAPFHHAHPAAAPRTHTHAAGSSAGTAVVASTGTSAADTPPTAPISRDSGDRSRASHHARDGSVSHHTGDSSDGSSGTSGDGGTISWQGGGGPQDGASGGDASGGGKQSTGGGDNGGGSGGGDATSGSGEGGGGSGDGGGAGDGGGSGGG